MKKGFLVVLMLGLIFPVRSQNAVPDILSGIWEGKDRFVFFDGSQDDENPELVILLKEYYGWYYDRAAEPASYAAQEQRIRNAATQKTAEKIVLAVNEIPKSNVYSDAFELELTYSKYQKRFVPVAVINGNLYLDFFVKDFNPEDSSALESVSGYWCGNAVSDGLKISAQDARQNVACLVIDGGKVFNIRYWLTDMEFSTELAQFSYDQKDYFVYRHILSAGNTYTSVNGRSKKIRNLVAPREFNADDFILNDDKTVLVPVQEPYLVQLADKNTFEQLMAMVKEANSRRKPPAEPPFPPSDVDWHWDLIDVLEKDNALIQAVRERQRQFGPRAKDSSQ